MMNVGDVEVVVSVIEQGFEALLGIPWLMMVMR